MVDSVGQTNSGTPGITGSETVSPVVTEDAVEGVAAGYSDSDTVSYVAGEGEAGVALDSSVSLDAPQSTIVDSRDFLQKAFDARLDGFRSIVSEFNARFNSSEIDISDTQTVLMVIKGIVSDTRALLSAQTVDQNASNRQLLQSSRLDNAREQQKLTGEIKRHQTDINDVSQQQTGKSLELAQKNTSKLLKEHELTNASGGDVTRLQGELAQVTVEITLLEHEAANLSQRLGDLQSQKAVSQASLTVVQQLLAFATEDIVTVRETLGKIKERYDSAALETGEKELLEAKRDNRNTEVRLNKEEMRQRTIKGDMKTLFKDEVDDAFKVSEKERRGNPLLAEDAPISQSQLELFSALVPVTPELLAQQNTSTPPTNEQLADVSYALALVLQADPPAPAPAETATEKQPVNQAHLGDNRSLEGADNPQAFGLLLLEQNMAQLREGAENTDQLASAEQVEAGKVMDVFGAVQEADAIVADSLEEAALADAVIRRSPV